MVYKGHIEDGRIVLDQGVHLPDGAQVEVVLPSTNAPRPAARMNHTDLADDAPTMYERLKHVIGKAEGLPSDFAYNHDHYIHGAPKK